MHPFILSETPTSFILGLALGALIARYLDVLCSKIERFY